MADHHTSKPVFPLLAIWRHPRLAMRSLIAKKSLLPGYFFAAASGVVNAVDFVQRNEFEQQWDASVLLGLTVGAGIVTGIAFLLLLSLLFMFFGRWLGGQGKFGQLNTAVGWAMLPFVGSLAVTVAEFVLYGDVYLAGGEALIQAQAAQPAADIVFLILNLLFAVYAIIFLVAGLTEAHGLRTSQGAGTLLIFVILYLVFWIAIQAVWAGL